MIRAFGNQTLLSLIGVMLMGFAQGCQTPCMDGPTIDQADVTPLPPGDFITAEQLMPLTPRSGRVSVTLKPQSPRQTDFSLTPDASGAGGGWRYTIDGLRTDHLQLSSDGDVMVRSTDEIIEGVTVEYEPAFIELPAVLVMGKPFHQQCRMTVRHLAGGGIRDQGRCVYTIELLGRLEVVTSAGRFDTYVVRTTRRIELQLAQSVVETVAAYAPGPGVGVIESATHQSTVALGWLRIKKNQYVQLIATDQRPPGADKNNP